MSVEGTITGFEVRNNDTRELITTRWENASDKWNSYVNPGLATLAQTTSSLTLNTVPLSTQVGFNPVAGTLTYHWEYDNRPTPATPNAVTESVTVSNHNAADVFAQIPVLGRPFGPVLQSIGTVTAKKRSISIDIQMRASTQDFAASPPNTNAIVLTLMPVSSLGVFLEQDEESFSTSTGRYTRQTVFVWE